jgi:hypothetical protein
MKSLPFSCEHVGCNLKFKTKKQKLIHHHNLEPDCKNEKYALIKTLALFKTFTFSMMAKFNISKEELEIDPVYKELKNNYEDVEKKMLDPDFFFMTLGDNFDELPKLDSI